MKRLILFFLSMFLLSLNSAKSNEMYVGIDYLNNKIDSGVTNISSNLDEKDSGYSLYVGFPLNNTFDLEISYNDFGKASLTGVTGNQFLFIKIRYTIFS